MKKNKFVPILIAALVIVVAVGALYIFVFSGDDAEKPVEYTEYSTGDFYVINVQGELQTLLKASFVLVVDTPDIVEDLTKDNNRIRDTLYTALRSIELVDLVDVKRTDWVKQQLVSAVNERLQITNVVDVYFNEFVLQ
jgi:flagellar basal body-associated protein FliL